jgi:hypothetical protein
MGFPNVKTKPSTGTVLDHSSTTSGAAPSGGHIVMVANESRTYFVFQNVSDTVMSINFAADAGASNSIVVQPGGSVTFNSAWVPSQEVRLRCSSASKAYVAKQGI